MSTSLARSQMEPNADNEVLERVCAQVRALQSPGSAATEITVSSLLIEDLGLDSLKLVDLTVRLEEALGIAEFPMQEWVDGQVAAARPLSVGELAIACRALLR